MAWIYFQELVGFQSLSNRGSDPLPIVRSIDTARASYCPRCDEVSLAALPYGTMCELSDKWCSQKLTSSMEVFRARTSALLELERAWRASAVVSFSRSLDSLASYDPASFSWKTSQLSLFGGSTEFSWSSLRWGMTVGGRLSQPLRWEPHTYASGGSYLPTPMAQEYGSNKGGGSGRVGKVRSSLSQMARKNLWPTPTASEASEASRGDSNSERRRKSPSLTSVANIEGGTKNGLLRPEFVEWLMGYPTGWTVLGDLETQWFRSKPEKLSCG